MHVGGHIRAGALALAAAVGIAIASTALTAGPARAAQGLEETGRARYVVTDEGSPVKVTQVVTVTNREPPTATRYFFWLGYSLWLPSGAKNLKVTSNGATLPSSVATIRGLDFAKIPFPSPLRYTQSRTFTVSYTIPGSPPRSARPGRVGRGYAAFDVYSPGDAGQATIEIVSPRWMTLDLGIDYTEKTVGDDRVATARGGGPDGLWSLMSLRDSSQVAKRTVSVDNHSFSIVAFPGDTRWSDHVAKHLPPTVRELERLTGQQWPTRSTTISEDFSRQVYGWDGTYVRGTIDISEALDRSLLAHELSHAWSNYDKLDERWLTEGLAQELTTQAMASLHGKDTKHPAVSPSQKGAFALVDWPDDGASANASEDYGYPASWRAVHSLVGGSGKVPHPELFRALTTHRSIYDAPGEATLTTHALTWKQAYDLFEVLGGNQQTRALMTRWVISPKDAKALTGRDTARKAYAARDQLDGAWAPPRGVRSAMAEWDFPGAGRALALTRQLAGHASGAQQAATRYDVDATVLRAAYQRADDSAEYRQVDAQLVSFTRQAAALGALRTDLDEANPLARLGGLVLGPADDLARAKAAIEKGDSTAADRALASATSATGRATGVGAGLVVALLVLLTALALAARWLRRRSPRAPGPDERSAGRVGDAHGVGGGTHDAVEPGAVDAITPEAVAAVGTVDAEAADVRSG